MKVDKLYTESKRELATLNMGKELGKAYLLWYSENRDDILRECFEGDYTEADVEYEIEVLKWHVLGKFYVWATSNMFEGV